MGETKEIARERDLTAEDLLARYMNPNKPVLIEGGASQMGAIGKWTPDFFRREYGQREVSIDYQTWTLAEYIDHIAASEGGEDQPYLRNWIVEETFPELLSDLSPHPYLLPTWFDSPFIPSRLTQPIHGKVDMHFGPKGARFVIHLDEYRTHAIVTQIFGEKEMILFTPGQDECLYPTEDDPEVSAVNQYNPDPSKHPLFASAERISCVCQPGDVLFIPAGWWHTTRVVSDLSINIGLNIMNGSNWHMFVREHSPAKRDNKLLALCVVTYLNTIRALRLVR